MTEDCCHTDVIQNNLVPDIFGVTVKMEDWDKLGDVTCVLEVIN